MKLAQKVPNLSYPLLSSLRGYPAVRQTIPVAREAHVTDVPKPRRSSGHRMLLLLLLLLLKCRHKEAQWPPPASLKFAEAPV